MSKQLDIIGLIFALRTNGQTLTKALACGAPKILRDDIARRGEEINRDLAERLGVIKAALEESGHFGDPAVRAAWFGDGS